jgi:hypothetical protein
MFKSKGQERKNVDDWTNGGMGKKGSIGTSGTEHFEDDSMALEEAT